MESGTTYVGRSGVVPLRRQGGDNAEVHKSFNDGDTHGTTSDLSDEEICGLAEFVLSQ